MRAADEKVLCSCARARGAAPDDISHTRARRAAMLEPLTAGLTVLLALLCALVWVVFRANAATLAHVRERPQDFALDAEARAARATLAAGGRRSRADAGAARGHAAAAAEGLD